MALPPEPTHEPLPHHLRQFRYPPLHPGTRCRHRRDQTRVPPPTHRTQRNATRSAILRCTPARDAAIVAINPRAAANPSHATKCNTFRYSALHPGTRCRHRRDRPTRRRQRITSNEMQHVPLFPVAPRHGYRGCRDRPRAVAHASHATKCNAFRYSGICTPARDAAIIAIDSRAAADASHATKCDTFPYSALHPGTRCRHRRDQPAWRRQCIACNEMQHVPLFRASPRHAMPPSS
jgi:hypothetical protein